MSSLRLEGFDGEIRGHRSLIIGKETDWLSRIEVLESESLYKGRSILVIHEPSRPSGTGSVPSALVRKRWDCIFRIREPFEAQMVATYVANAPKPVRILWFSTGGQEIPRALWQKWSYAGVGGAGAGAGAGSDISLIGCSHSGEPLGCEWEAIFFPLQNTPQFTERVLGMRGSGMRSLAANVSSYLTEIAQSGAALVWSNIDEKDSRGALYWYDPNEGSMSASEKLTKAEAISMIDELKIWVSKNI
jgi:hypothetical protein